MTRIESGMDAPNFSLKAVDGKEYSLSTLLERGPVVVGFFKISCPVCQFTFPFLQRIAERFAGKSGSVIGISQDDARSTKEFNQEYGVKFPTLVDDPGYSVSNAYGLTNVPTVLLIAPDGRAKVSFLGFDKAGLEKIADELAPHARISASPLFRPDEVIPDYKPG
ncbi:MAG TPA: TlpA disulfide reductase family protein [Candidatus Limnocylindrales bacterium]|nr:TlpA disulfide reductase family protein [Candidatus Limnocylindrales bacterium]